MTRVSVALLEALNVIREVKITHLIRIVEILIEFVYQAKGGLLG